jgi:uncharacterized protein (DUF1697 family)
MNFALIRGINVGGHKKVGMAELRAMFESLGLSDVKSLLQSGNVAFSGGHRRTLAGWERVLGEEAAKRLGLDAEFFVRTAKEWDALIAGNPFPRQAKADPARLVLTCLKDAPGKGKMDALRASIVGSEIVQADGRHLYTVFPDGIGTSRLTSALMEKKLGTRGTGRNWNTVLKLQRLAEESAR